MQQLWHGGGVSFVYEPHVRVACAFDFPIPLQVNMEPGDMVMYESAKQYHARLTPMRGRHYGSVFIHYFPAADNWNWTM